MVIKIYPTEELSRHRRLFDAFSNLYSVDFVGVSELCKISSGAAILFGVDRQQAISKVESGLRCLVFPNGPPGHYVTPGNVRLASSPYLSRCLQGRTFADEKMDGACNLKTESGDEILAWRDNSALWIHCQRGASSLDLVAMKPRQLADNGYLHEHFNRDEWIGLLPILSFVREASGWTYPPLRAAFMLDDPNLHRESYGYVEFGKLVRHASKYNYHVSFATVPMDGWHVSANAAQQFRENKNCLSLLIHGNNHTADELAQARPECSRKALAAQALTRIEYLERASGVEVSRVMAAPHGACSHQMASTLLQMGFEAACISRGSIMHHNPGTNWPPAMGLRPAEFLGDGLPVIPRFRLRRGCETEMILAAFLGQPVIPVGHHEDLAGGLDLLSELAGILNSIGEVQWCNMQSIARSNFCSRREGKTLHVKMYSRKILLKVPDGVNDLCIHRPWLKDGDSECLTLQTAANGLAVFPAYMGQSLASNSYDEVEIHAVPMGPIDPRTVKHSRTPLWTIARRQLCEARDRLKPMKDKLFANI